MKTRIILLYLIFTSFSALAQIQVGANNNEWTITTRSSVYRIRLSSGGDVNSVYYGNKLLSENMGGNMGAEIPVRGGHVSGTPMVEVVFADGVRDIELIYDSYEILDIDGYKTLKITQKDKFYPFTIHSFIRVLPEYDLIEKWVEVSNTGKKGVIRIENLQSGSVFLPGDSYELTHYSGIW